MATYKAGPETPTNEAKAWYENNKEVANTLGFVVLILLVNRRMVRRAVRKVIVQELEHGYVSTNTAMDNAAKAFYEGWYMALGTPGAISEAFVSNKALESAVKAFGEKYK